MIEILHLEDEGPLCEILAAAIENVAPGVKLHQFANSDYALTFLQEHITTIDLFILDIRVPGEIDGLELATKVRELGSTRPIIVTSAYIKPQRAKLETIGAQWMAKPWHILELTEKIIPLATSKT